MPVWVDGLRDGRRCRPRELRVAAAGVAAKALPFPFPDVELLDGLFSPPPSVARGRLDVARRRARATPASAQGIDGQARADLKALGYLP